VTYKGSEPPPDTFKDDSQALAEGSYGRDGVFHASVLQAKCASKYAPPGRTSPPSRPAPQSRRAQVHRLRQPSRLQAKPAA
jgi:cytochrome c-type biogenesis protein CcmE